MRRCWQRAAAGCATSEPRELSGSHVFAGVMGRKAMVIKQQRQNRGSLTSRSKLVGKQMGKAVAGSQQDLEKQQARVPDSGTASEPGQNVFSQNRLHQKQQESAQEYGECIHDHTRTQRVIRVQLKGNWKSTSDFLLLTCIFTLCPALALPYKAYISKKTGFSEDLGDCS